MSTPYVPVARREHGIIGSNIRRGHTPGGFTHQLGAARTNHVRKRRDIYTDSREIKEAAQRVLEKRGILSEGFQQSIGAGGFQKY